MEYLTKDTVLVWVKDVSVDGQVLTVLHSDETESKFLLSFAAEKDEEGIFRGINWDEVPESILNLLENKVYGTRAD